MQLDDFTDVAGDIVMSSIQKAKSLKKAPVPEFILEGIIEHADSPVSAMMISHKIDKDKVLRETKEYLTTLPEAQEAPDEEEGVITVHPRLAALLERAKKAASDAGDTYVDTLTVFKQFYTEGTDNKGVHLLTSNGMSLEKAVSSFKKIRGNKKVKTRKERSDAKVLEKYCTNMVKAASLGEFSPVIGREFETRRIIQILCRKSKNNPIIIGESGVGKTAVVEGLAQRIHRGDVPDFLEDSELYELQISALVGGAKHRGDLEERVTELMDVITDLPKNIVLFIDEIHSIGKSGGDVSLSDLLKPALSRNKIRIIGPLHLMSIETSLKKIKLWRGDCSLSL